MTTAGIIFAVLLGVLGIVGSIVPALPGPPLSWLGLLIMYFCKGDEVSTSVLLIWLAVTIIVTVIDYIMPGWITKLSGGSKYAGIGATIGLFAGMFLTPVGMILGALLGAFIAEVIFAEKGVWDSAKSALGAFAGFLLGTGIKLIVSGMMFWKIITSF